MVLLYHSMIVDAVNEHCETNNGACEQNCATSVQLAVVVDMCWTMMARGVMVNHLCLAASLHDH